MEDNLQFTKDLAFLVTLIRTNSRIIIPELGAFLVNDLEQGFRAENVSFSPFLRYNDGTFKQKLSEYYSISDSEAQRRIEELADWITHQLKEQGEMEIPSLGRILTKPMLHFEAGSERTLTNEKPPQPTPTATSTANLRQEEPQTGSTPIEVNPPHSETPPTPSQTVRPQQAPQGPKKLQPVRRPVTPKVTKNERPKREKAPTGERKGKKRLLIILLIVLLLPLLTFLTLYIVNPESVTHLLALQPEKTSLNQPESELSTPEDGVRVDYDGGEESAADLTNPENAPNPAEAQGNSAEALLPASEPLRSETTASQQPTNDRRYAQPDANHTYHIVVGSFKDTDNARNYVARLQQQGYTPSLLDRPETMQAVSIGSFESLAEAEKIRKNLSDHFPDAWILHP